MNRLSVRDEEGRRFKSSCQNSELILTHTVAAHIWGAGSDVSAAADEEYPIGAPMRRQKCAGGRSPFIDRQVISLQRCSNMDANIGLNMHSDMLCEIGKNGTGHS